MRLINVDDLEDMEMETCDTDDSIVIKERVAGRNYIRQIVKDAPTIDAAPIVHAYWIPGAGDFTNGNSTHECSHCGDFIDYYKGGADEYNFCPYCGAMMDGKPPVDSNKR